MKPVTFTWKEILERHPGRAWPGDPDTLVSLYNAGYNAALEDERDAGRLTDG